MRLMIELSPEREAAIQAQAQARGLTIEQWLLELAAQHAPLASIVHLQKSDPRGWARHFDAWVDSHDPQAPVLSEEAMNRTSIYPDRT